MDFFEHLALVGIVRQLRHDMSFIVGIIVIAVDNSDGIIQLQTVLKAPVRFWETGTAPSPRPSAHGFRSGF